MVTRLGTRSVNRYRRPGKKFCETEGFYETYRGLSTTIQEVLNLEDEDQEEYDKGRLYR